MDLMLGECFLLLYYTHCGTAHDVAAAAITEAMWGEKIDPSQQQALVHTHSRCCSPRFLLTELGDVIAGVQKLKTDLGGLFLRLSLSLLAV